jgi:hypothetical protein
MAEIVAPFADEADYRRSQSSGRHLRESRSSAHTVVLGALERANSQYTGTGVRKPQPIGDVSFRRSARFHQAMGNLPPHRTDFLRSVFAA